MQVGTGAYTYTWIDNWARIPETESGKRNGRTHAVVVTKAGTVVVFHQADPAVLVFAANGTLQQSWGHDYAGAHGMTLVEEGVLDLKTPIDVSVTFSDDNTFSVKDPWAKKDPATLVFKRQ